MIDMVAFVAVARFDSILDEEHLFGQGTAREVNRTLRLRGTGRSARRIGRVSRFRLPVGGRDEFCDSAIRYR